MNKFFEGSVRYPIVSIVVFLFLAGMGAVMQPFVSVNYDMADYLPENTPSTVAMDTMSQEFDGAIPNVRVMLRGVTIPRAMDYKDRLLRLDGVNDVVWMDNATDVYQPLHMIDKALVDTYYKDDTVLFMIAIEEGGDADTTIEQIRQIVGRGAAMTGEAVSTAFATEVTLAEVDQIAIFAVILLIVILIITTPSWLEPLVIMLGLGVAIIINIGTNLIFGEISFVTNAAGSLLQLAVSLDYSVFLMHRFEETLKYNHNPKSAMVEALSKASSSIFSGGVTTVIGFFALVFMRFQIGPDLGLALGKGIIISLITVFFFMPSLILVMFKPMQRFRHKPFVPGFNRFGRLTFRVTYLMVLIVALLAGPSFLASSKNLFYYGSTNIFEEGSDYYTQTKEVEAIYGKNDTYVVMVPKGNIARETNLSHALKAIPQVRSVTSYVDTIGAEIPVRFVDSQAVSTFISPNYSRMLVSVDADPEGDATFALVEQVRTTIQNYYPDQYHLVGEGVVTYDLMDTITADTVKINLIAIGAVTLVLLLMMRSLVLPILLVLTIESAIWINLAIPYFTGQNIFYISYLIISAIQLGATVDYAILYTDRYMEMRHSMLKRDAIIQTSTKVTLSMLVSGLSLTAVGLTLGLISSNIVLSQLGIFIGRGALLSLFTVLFVLPGLLYAFDWLIMRTTQNTDSILANDKELLHA